MSIRPKPKHLPCPCGCGEMADECMNPRTPYPLSAFVISGVVGSRDAWDPPEFEEEWDQ